MTQNIDTKPTVEAINNMATLMSSKSEELRQTARRLQDTGDFSRVADAMSIITNMVGNLRLELLIVRPLRAYEDSQGGK